MPDQNELEFNINRVGDGPVFEVIVNNVRLDIHHVGQLFSIRISGLITETQWAKLGKMFAGNDKPECLVYCNHNESHAGRFEDCPDEDCKRVVLKWQQDADVPPFDGPYTRGPVLP